MMQHGDFTELAADYAQFRPGYSPAVRDIVVRSIAAAGLPRAMDVGAGTGIWTRALASSGVSVTAVEPNAAMRAEGEKGNGALPIEWRAGSAESTGLPDASVDLVSMASALHWADFDVAMREFQRVLRPGGRILALWNTRVIADNPLLVDVEAELRRLVPDYRPKSSGRSEFCDGLTRRLQTVPGLSDVLYLEGRHVESQTPAQYLGVWRSVNDVRVQAGPERFAQFLDYITRRTAGVDRIEAGYLTRAWLATKHR